MQTPVTNTETPDDSLYSAQAFVRAQQTMLDDLRGVTGVDFTTQRSHYEAFMTGAMSAVQESEFYGHLVDLHKQLTEEFVLGKVRAIDSWSDGESEFLLVTKPWASVVDKLFRINIEDNELDGSPPIIPTIEERASRQRATRQLWITPNIVHEVADDLVRTKFVVPFVDGVVDVGDRITNAIDACGLRRFRRFHAKDSGYHARHYYIILAGPGLVDGRVTGEVPIALEVKVLTKMQDMLGEVTHLLYEKHRTGQIPVEKKRKLAWQFDRPDFMATYLGHSGHLLEASVAELKDKILELGGENNGEP